MNFDSIDIKALRAQLKPPMTQKQLAECAGVDQSTISRVEENPRAMTIELLFKMCSCLGVTVDEAVQGLVPDHGLRIEVRTDAYADLEDKAALVRSSADPDTATDDDRDLPGLRDVEWLAEDLERKPNLVITGPFDAGKSTLVNLLLGERSLVPTRYTPTTSVVTYLRHTSDRPTWCEHDVLVLGPDFEAERWRDFDHVRANILLAGDRSMVQDRIAHGEGHLHSASAALVFHDADILRTCALVYTPGDDNNDADAKKTLGALQQRSADVLVYMSPVIGFFSETQMVQLDARLATLADPGPGLPTGRNLYVLASHASPQNVEDDDLDLVFESASKRFTRHLGLDISEQPDDPDGLLDRPRALAGALRSRMFPFYRGTTDGGLTRVHSRGDEFLTDLSELLEALIPGAADTRARALVDDYCAKATTLLADRLAEIKAIHAEAAEAAERLPGLEEQVDLRKKDINGFEESLRKAAAKHRAQSHSGLPLLLERELGKGLTERIIRERYSKAEMAKRSPAEQSKGAKKLAQQEMPGLMVKRVTDAVERDLVRRSKRFADEVDHEMASLKAKFQEVNWLGGASIPMDLDGAFIGGAMSSVAVGALALWASTLGNLGAYIIAAQAAGWLATLGISLPAGGASLTAAMAAIGGPIGVAVAIVAIGVLIGLAFKASWEERLAKAIYKQLTARTVKGRPGLAARIENSIHDYWDDTEEAVHNGATEMLTQLESQLARWKLLTDKNSEEARVRRRQRIETTLTWVSWLSRLWDQRPPKLA